MNARTAAATQSERAVPARIFPFRGPASARPRLYCLPHAGGTASLYRAWLEPLAELWQVLPVEYAGHGTRRRESPRLRFAELRDEVVEAIAAEQGDAPFALFGHSLGALLAFEVAREFEQHRGVRPKALFLSATRAPHLQQPPPTPIATLSDDALVAEIRRYDGIPAPLLAPEILAFFLPVLRADFEIFESYVATEGPPLACPLVVFGGDADPSVSQADLEGWARYSTRFDGVQLLPGSHFYLQAEQQRLFDALRARAHWALP